MKVSIIGAGNVGAMIGMRVAESDLCDVVLLDAIEGLPQGKALDLENAAPIIGHHRKITGTNDYKEIVDSDVVVVTAGVSRQSGMERRDLLKRNAYIVKDVVSKVVTFSPGAILLIVTNPLDVMTYLAYRLSGFKPQRVFGVAGVLDAARFSTLIAQELNVPVSEIVTIVLGGHDKTMVPLPRHSTVSGTPLVELLSKEKIEELIAQTRETGTKIVSFLKTGSAYYGPSAAAYSMIESIIKNKKKVMPTSAYLSGQYGLDDICIGVPARLGRKGIEEIVELVLNEEEKEAFNRSAETIKESIKELMKEIK